MAQTNNKQLHDKEAPSIDEYREIASMYLTPLTEKINGLFWRMDGEPYSIEDYTDGSEELEAIYQTFPKNWAYDLKYIGVFIYADIIAIMDEEQICRESKGAGIRISNLIKAATLQGRRQFNREYEKMISDGEQ